MFFDIISTNISHKIEIRQTSEKDGRRRRILNTMGFKSLFKNEKRSSDDESFEVFPVKEDLKLKNPFQFMKTKSQTLMRKKKSHLNTVVVDSEELYDAKIDFSSLDDLHEEKLSLSFVERFIYDTYHSNDLSSQGTSKTANTLSITESYSHDTLDILEVDYNDDDVDGDDSILGLQYVESECSILIDDDQYETST